MPPASPESQLPVPPTGDGAVDWVAEHLADVLGPGPVEAAGSFRGGQVAADAALASFDVTGYASRRNQVHPPERRGASALSPWIRHGLLQLRDVWDHVAGGPAKDVSKFRDELLWQEYARHWYARLGTETRAPVRHHPPGPGTQLDDLDRAGDTAWDRDMRCIDEVVGELERDGWLVNQTRMWVASHWTVRQGLDWADGEEWLLRHLLDGSRAANRLGWQWTTGAGSSKAYGFARWQVEKRAPQWCEDCALSANCPIQSFPSDTSLTRADRPELVGSDPSPGTTAGPDEPTGAATVEAVWLTAESLGDADPALAAHPDVPAVFVFDEPLLRSLRLAPKRLVFLAQCLADLAERREVEVHLGRPVEVLRGRSVAVTFAPVPGFASRSRAIDPVRVHPWPWLVAPHGRSISSFSAWRKHIRTPANPSNRTVA